VSGSRRRLRIVMVVNPSLPVPPPRYGGTQRIAGAVARGLTERGDKVTMLAGTGSSVGGVRHVAIRFRFPAPRVIRAWWFLRQWSLVRWHARRADVVIGFWREDFLVGAVPRSCRTIMTHHEPISESRLRPLPRTLRVSVSDDQRSHLPPEGWTTVHNGVDTDYFTPDPGRSGGYFAFLGRLSPEKGVDTAIRVARAAGVPLRIGGNLPASREAQAAFEADIRPALGDGVEWLGELDDEQKRDLLRRADALLFPIRGPEAFGLVMAEALACGTPVIAARGWSTPEVVRHGETGFLCDDERAMVEAVRRVAGIDRQACRQDGVERFSEERMVHEYLRLIDDLVEETE
jgi:glycosyltransferase involved in cell wall biosynthesis